MTLQEAREAAHALADGMAVWEVKRVFLEEGTWIVVFGRPATLADASRAYKRGKTDLARRIMSGLLTDDASGLRPKDGLEPGPPVTITKRHALGTI
ncbi:MAG TPA: hypothetical protein VF192_01440 [Longimicrobiales bacterium]